MAGGEGGGGGGAVDVDAVATDGSALGTAERMDAAAVSDLTGYPPISDYAAIGDCRLHRSLPPS
jgi:hypothetical protein